MEYASSCVIGRMVNGVWTIFGAHDMDDCLLHIPKFIFTVSVNLLTILFFWAKAFSVYLILKLLRVTNQANALFIGILFMIYPADTALLALRTFGHKFGSCFFLLSVLFLILSCKSSNKLYLIPMVIAHVLSSFMSEAGSILAFFAPLLILLFPKCTRSTKIAILTIWYIILLSSLINYSFYWIAGGN